MKLCDVLPKRHINLIKNLYNVDISELEEDKLEAFWLSMRVLKLNNVPFEKRLLNLKLGE